MPAEDRPPLTTERDPDAETAFGGVDPPERPQVPWRTRAGGWTRENLFGSWRDGILTLVFGAGLGWAVYRALRFLFVTGRWEIIDRNLTNLMVFRWPERPDLVRPWLALFVATAVLGFLVGRGTRARLEAEALERADADVEHPPLPQPRRDIALTGRRLWPMFFLMVGIVWFSGAPTTAGMMVVLVAVLVGFRSVGLRIPHHLASRITWPAAGLGAFAALGALMGFGGHGWGAWGGLLLTLFLATGGIILSFPFGVGLALGRRSSFPVVRLFSTIYIELVRGVPLITLLLMGSLMLGFFLPDFLSDLHRVSRALVAIILFTAAYVAEIVRGGLQSVPKGQVEAAQAVGMPPLKITRLIVLPQALRNVIPAMVGQFISLFKDTSLVAIIGLFELFGVAQAITSQGDFAGQGLLGETLVFVSFVYWVFTYTMSRESQRLEQRLGVGER